MQVFPIKTFIIEILLAGTQKPRLWRGFWAESSGSADGSHEPSRAFVDVTPATIDEVGLVEGIGEIKALTKAVADHHVRFIGVGGIEVDPFGGIKEAMVGWCSR